MVMRLLVSRRQNWGRPPPPAPPPRWEEGAVGGEGPCLCPSEEEGSGVGWVCVLFGVWCGSTTESGVQSVFGSHQERLSRSTRGFSLRLEIWMRWWRVEPALSSRGCLGLGLMRAWVSTAGDCREGQLPVVRHCYHGFRALRLDLWLCCDSVAPQSEEPRCLQTYDTDP
eukprot:scaffold3523_cov108-Isochrysis_galbana.AAC.3